MCAPETFLLGRQGSWSVYQSVSALVIGGGRVVCRTPPEDACSHILGC